MNGLPLLSQSKPGFLNFGEARMALIDIKAGFWSIRRQVEALIGRGQTNYVLQRAGVNGGFSFADRFHDFGSDHTIEDIFRACLNAYQNAGFGEFELLRFSIADCTLQVRGNSTFEAWMTLENGPQQNGEGFCAYTAGVLVGSGVGVGVSVGRFSGVGVSVGESISWMTRVGVSVGASLRDCTINSVGVAVGDSTLDTTPSCDDPGAVPEGKEVKRK